MVYEAEDTAVMSANAARKPGSPRSTLLEDAQGQFSVGVTHDLLPNFL